MFLNYIKDFFAKKSLKNHLNNLKNINAVGTIQNVGVLIDATDFEHTDLLIEALTANGIASENIKVMVFHNKFRKNETNLYSIVNAGDLKWNGQILDVEIVAFCAEKFDLLISYYEKERAILMQITHNSKAQFKVGFSSVDKRLNHFMIKTTITAYTIFVSELFKYLKLLNKI
ncbi:DUF6913 domain-containing protein [Flavobacterium sandaracinum]|uniref:Uncharacterized protein n=1 Tax=Flavobacterium sandaracinum TaxID=2541733 RepID=A0A4R5D710_9FLAO|nr:hypothetical protein [Flavobacterium sandaracinum]TDE07114.1 hypothetical protein E0F91_02155 [Flavobacterium sandaracinum]